MSRTTILILLSLLIAGDAGAHFGHPASHGGHPARGGKHAAKHHAAAVCPPAPEHPPHPEPIEALELVSPPLLSNVSGIPMLCSLVNAGSVTNDVEIEILSLGGASKAFTLCSPPAGTGCNLSTTVGAGTAVYCRVTLVTGTATDYRASLYWLDVNGIPLGAVQAR